jgi:hypothetical protein
VKPAADAAYAGEGPFQSGEWCRFCKAKADCRARAERNWSWPSMRLESRALLTDDREIESILNRLMS